MRWWRTPGSGMTDMKKGIRMRSLFGTLGLAVAACCLSLIAGAVSSQDYLRIRAVPPDEATRFVRGEHWTIYLDGTIDAGAADRLSGILSAEGIDAASVYLNSRGGDLAAGVAIGTVIREAGFSTAVGRETTNPPNGARSLLQRLCIGVRRRWLAVSG